MSFPEWDEAHRAEDRDRAKASKKGVGSTGIKNARDTKWQMQTVVTAECCAQELITLSSCFVHG